VLYDAHNHAQKLGKIDELNDVAGRSLKAGIVRMTVCATGERGDWELVRTIGEEGDSFARVCMGIHPWYVGMAPLGWKHRLEHELDAVACGVGEIGLDTHSKQAGPIEDQIAAFKWQLDLALDRSLPAVVHCVGAWDKLQPILKERPKLRFLLHGYKGSPEMALQLARQGAWFSFGPTTLVTRTPDIAEVLARVPPERLMIETDAPDGCLKAGMENGEPTQLVKVCEALAKELKQDAEAVAKRTFDNAERFFATKN
jgi:TatD DNase family protein